MSKISDGRTTLARKPEDVKDNLVCAIEVYPKLTLRHLCKEARLPEEDLQGYKSSKKSSEKREKIAAMLSELKNVEIEKSKMTNKKGDYDDNLIDAVLCVVEGRNFYDGEGLKPDSCEFKKWLEKSKSPSNTDEIVKQEGWIWFHKDLLRCENTST